MTRRVRVFRPAAERLIVQRLGIRQPITDARRLLRAGQENTARWLDARTRTIGASEIGILMMADHPYHSLFSLWHVKRHGWGRHEQTPAQERGHLLEEGIARKFAAAHPELVVARPNGSLWADPEHPHLSCTPDFLTIDETGLIVPLECKSDEGGDGWGPGDDDIPAHHWWQVNQQAGVFAAPYAYIARWSMRGYRDYTIAYDHDRYVKGAAEARLFLADVAAGHEPEPDGHRSTGSVLRDLHPEPVYVVQAAQIPPEWGDELAALKATRAEVDKQIKDYDHKIRALLGDAPTGWDVRGRVYTRTRTPRKGFTVPPTVLDQVRTREPLNQED